MDLFGLQIYSRHVTKIPPLAGTAEDWARAKWIKDQWLDSGLDSVQIIPYDVLLSDPDREQPKKVRQTMLRATDTQIS